MRNPFTIPLVVSLVIFLTAGVALAAPTSRLERTLIPETTTTYSLGSTVSSWLNVYTSFASTTITSATTVCISTDCRTSWPASGTYTATYPVTLTGSAFGLAFGTTTSNTWAGTQTFTNTPVLGTLSGIVKASTGVLSAAAAGTDYVAPATTITVAGTSNQITSSAGAQDLSTNRTWTLSLPNHVIFPASFQVVSASTTNATTTQSQYFPLLATVGGAVLSIDANGKVGTTTASSGSGTSPLATSTHETSGNVTIFTSNSGTPATVGDVSGFSFGSSNHQLSIPADGWHTLGGRTFIYGTDSVVGLGHNTTVLGLGAGGQQATTTGVQSNNTAVGSFALGAGVSASTNTAIGSSALGGTTSGDNNVALGASASIDNTTGSQNTALGTTALNDNTTGDYNLALGYGAGAFQASLRTGAFQRNTYVGALSGPSGVIVNRDLYDNIAIGYSSGALSYGWNNLFVGGLSGQNNTTGNNNLAIGYNALVQSATASNQLNLDNIIFGTGITATSSSATLLPSPTGNIGIGTTSPYARFSVAGISADTTPLFAISSTTSGYATSTAITVDSNGKLGVGTSSPMTQLSIGGNVAIGASSAGGTNGTLTYGGVTLANSVTGTGSMVLSTSPSLTTPALGTPTSLTLTSATGLPTAGVLLTKGNFMVGNDSGIAQATSTVFISSLGYFGLSTTTPTALFSVGTGPSGFYITPTGKVVGYDLANGWDGRINPTRSFAITTASTTWGVGTTTSQYFIAGAMTMPFAGTLRTAQCNATSTQAFLGIQPLIGATAPAPAYFVASSTAGLIKFTATNTFTAGQTIGMYVGTSTASTNNIGVTCTFQVTETP